MLGLSPSHLAGPRPRTAWARGALTVCALAIWTACVPGQADAAGRERCQSLDGRRLALTSAVKVVERPAPSRALVLACVRPAGRVRLLAVAHDETADSGYEVKVLAVSGTWVALSLRNVVDFHGSEEVVQISDTRNGRSHEILEQAIPEGPGFEEASTGGVALEALKLNRSGQAAIALLAGETVRIVGVEADGTGHLLDSGPLAQLPPSSLTLDGRVAHWLHGGSARSAEL